MQSIAWCTRIYHHTLSFQGESITHWVYTHHAWHTHTHTHTLLQYGNTEVVFNKLKHGIPREDIDSYDPSLVTSPPLDHPTSFTTYPAIGPPETNASFSPQAFRRITSHDPSLSGHESGSPGKLHVCVHSVIRIRYYLSLASQPLLCTERERGSGEWTYFRLFLGTI